MGFVAKFDVVDAYFESKGTCDVFVHKEFPSLGCDNVLPNCPDHSHASSSLFTALFFLRVLF